MPDIMKQNVTYHYEQNGNPDSPETLVFVHGSCMTGKGMLPFAGQFAEYNCICVDLPGHGGSSGQTKTTIGAFTDSLIEMIEELQKSKAATDCITILGYSMGGCIAVEAAIRNTGWLKRVVVISSGADLKGNTPLLDTFNARKDDEFHAEDLFPHLGGRYTTEEELAGEIEVMSANKCSDIVGLTDLRTSCEYSRLADAAGIRIPLLVAAGDDDKIVPVKISIRLREAVPGSELLVLPYRGHSMFYEEMDTVVRTVKDFFRFHS